MKKLLFIPVLAALFLLVPAQDAQAQTSIQVGPRIGIDVGDASDLGGDFFIGADGRIASESLPVIINPAFDYYFVDADGVSLFTLDANALYQFGVDNQAFTPYAGGGLGYVRTSVDAGPFGDVGGSDIGLNLVGGAEFETGNLKPFVQAKVTLGDFTLFNIMGGVLFSF